MTSLDELERDLGPQLTAAYREQMPRWEHPPLDGPAPHVAKASRRRPPILAAAAALVAVLGAGLIWVGQRDREAGVATQPAVATTLDQPTDSAAPATSIAAPTETAAESTASTIGTTVADRTGLSVTLTSGMSGPEVEMVQQRLDDLGFFLGPVDGTFGDLTTQAVWAFETLVIGVQRSDATGEVTNAVWERMQDDVDIAPRRATGSDHVEIYLPEQAMVVFHNDQPAVIAHVSTGMLADGATSFAPFTNAAEYCEVVTFDTGSDGVLLDEPVEEARCGLSYTPPGVFTAYRMVKGRHAGSLGEMWNPIYINQGITIHGADDVPLEPASHGTIRVSLALSEVLQTTYIEPDAEVMIWDGITDPWDQPPHAMQMRYDYPDPNAQGTP